MTKKAYMSNIFVLHNLLLDPLPKLFSTSYIIHQFSQAFRDWAISIHSTPTRTALPNKILDMLVERSRLMQYLRGESLEPFLHLCLRLQQCVGRGYFRSLSGIPI